MSADLLRRAATKLRDLAEKAQHKQPWCPDYTYVAVRHVQRNCDLEVECTHHADRQDCGSFDMYDGPYVALMHPPVALALAEWLVVTAAQIEGWAENYGLRERDGDLTETDHAAIAVARAILREEPPTELTERAADAIADLMIADAQLRGHMPPEVTDERH